MSWIQFFIPAKAKSVKGEIVLVTGAGSGLGQGIAVEFAKLGSVVVLWDISEKGLQETAKLIRDVDGLCYTYICDVSDRAQVRQTGRAMATLVGAVTILVNNAGVVSGRKLLELRDEQIERTLNVNLLAHMWTTKQFLPSMLENNHGHIVNIGSSCGLVGISHLVDYSASKFGVTGFTQTLNYEIHFSGHDGVFTTLVCPSHIHTDMFSGCKMAFPALLPTLELKPTVRRIMQAILTNQHEVYIPRMVYLVAALKQMLPVSAMYEIIQIFRADKFMASFTGRQEDRDKFMKPVNGRQEDRDQFMDSFTGRQEDRDKFMEPVNGRQEDRDQFMDSFTGRQEDRDKFMEPVNGRQEDRDQFMEPVNGRQEDRDKFMDSFTGRQEDRDKFMEPVNGRQEDRDQFMDSFTGRQEDRDKFMEPFTGRQEDRDKFMDSFTGRQEDRDKFMDSFTGRQEEQEACPQGV
ncbi:hypothetical protein BsWGS_24613 [Bradybaena similaris]